MKMNRRTLLKFLPAALVAPAVALGKGKAKPKPLVDDGPRWKRPCASAKWLGRFTDGDLWVVLGTDGCGEPYDDFYANFRTVYNRPNAWRRNEWSRPPTAFEEEAYRRAVARGMTPKAKAEPRFPQWFVWNPPGPSTDALNDVFRVDAENLVYSVSRIGRKPKRLHHHKPLNHRDGNGRWILAYDDGPTTLSDMVEGVARGFFREITAAEAKALLKAKPEKRHANDFFCRDVIATLDVLPGWKPAYT